MFSFKLGMSKIILKSQVNGKLCKNCNYEGVLVIHVIMSCGKTNKISFFIIYD